jgi:hypothetical protein
MMQRFPPEESNSLPMLPWFPAAFAGSTRGWPLIAKGGYRELLDANWDQGSLPIDPEELRTLIGTTKREWKVIWSRCEEKFPIVETENGKKVRMNRRLESHRQKALERKEKNQRSGRLGGQASAQVRSLHGYQANAQAIGSPNAPATLDHTSTSTSTSGVSREEAPNREKPHRTEAPKLDMHAVLTPTLREVIRATNSHCDPEIVWSKYKRFCEDNKIAPENIANHLRGFATKEKFNESQYNSRKAAELAEAPRTLSQIKDQLAARKNVR